MKEARVIKKNERYYPQYLTISFFCKVKKWNYFYYAGISSIGNDFVEPINEVYNFKTKHEARYFLRIKGYKL